MHSDAEWTELTDYLGEEDVIGGKLKEADTIHWDSPNTGATNETGFTALLGGSVTNLSECFGLGSYGGWWSATEPYAEQYAWCRILEYNDDGVIRHGPFKRTGYSVRCIRD